MSPVEPPGPGHVGRAALVSVVAIVLLFGGMWLVSVALQDRNSPDLRLGDQTYRANAADLASTIAKGGPVLLGDVSGRQDRDIIIQHLGDDPETGWHVFAAQPADRARDCVWQWQPDEELFRASCDDSLTAPADGEGLTRYQASVDGGTLVVDLNFDERTSQGADATDDAQDADEATTTSTAAG